MKTKSVLVLAGIFFVMQFFIGFCDQTDEFDIDAPHEFYKTLFSNISVDSLKSIATEDDRASVASQSAWKLVRIDRNESRVHSVDWFLGFFSGRNRVYPPSWWIELVRSFEPINGRTKMDFSLIPNYKTSSVGLLHCPANATLKELNGGIVYRVADNSVWIKGELMTKTDAGTFYGNVNCFFHGSKCYFVNHDPTGSWHEIVCLDPVNGKVIWTNQSVGCFWSRSIPNGSRSFVDFLIEGDALFVFGASNTGGFYATSVHLQNGKPLLQFSSRF